MAKQPTPKPTLIDILKDRTIKQVTFSETEVQLTLDNRSEVTISVTRFETLAAYVSRWTDPEEVAL